MNLLLLVTIVCSIAAQLAAAAIALSRLRETGRFWLAWISVSLALLLMILRRATEIWQWLHHGNVNAINSLMGLLISLLMLYGMVGLRRLFDHLRAQEAEMARQAHTDFLTGLHNRRDFFEIGERELVRTRRHGSELAVLMLDIDFFKAVNDRHGHQAGDQVLQGLCRICQQNIRSIDLAGRLGGEEFAILLPDTGSVRALEVAERLRAAVAVQTLPVAAGVPIAITVSIGVAALGAHHDDLTSLLHSADTALYAAKSAGRNRVHLADNAAPLPKS
ncbi:MAG: GGDEF domain-containing protein [Rhodoferax sp.]|uniref:GGDEF domain-containing protein n=1 Tax=Rhodoferax sp. TaxID=50421 RepID=UPI001B41A979|nr:GGDEF domain-containing protein [Rhodoferax sp.]MBP9905251.1 GGDEF domain-containing protein [Rhodoferax sp.]